MAKAALYWAHRTIEMIPASSLGLLPWNGTRVDLTAAVERAHSDRARSGSKGSTWVSFLLRSAFPEFHRAVP